MTPALEHADESRQDGALLRRGAWDHSLTKYTILGIFSNRQCPPALAAVELGEQAQDLEVQPHDGDQKANCSNPFHLLGKASLGTLFDEVEVERKVERCNASNQEAEADAQA